QGGMSHPEVGAVPAGCLIAGAQGGAEERPLCAPVTSLLVRQVCRDVPPFDAKAVMRAVIAWKLELMATRHRSEVAGLLAQPRKAGIGLRFGRLVARGKQRQRAGQYEASANVHRKIASTGLLAAGGPAARPVRRQPADWSA